MLPAEIHNKSRGKKIETRQKGWYQGLPLLRGKKGKKKKPRKRTPKLKLQKSLPYRKLRGQYTADTSYTRAGTAAARGEEESWSYQPFLRANRLLSSASTLGTLNCTYSRSRSS